MSQISRSVLLALAPAVLGATLLAGCAIGPDYHRPDAASADRFKVAPDSAPAGTAGAPAQTTVADRWWLLFNDDLLNGLEDQVVVNNQNIAQAEAAYMQARATVREVRSSLLPTFSGSAGVTRSGGGTALLPGSTTATAYSVGGSASWELDVWGGLRRRWENAKATAQASAAELAAARLSAQSELAIAYLQLRGADAQQKLLSGTVEAYARTLTITQNRYNQGTAARTDVLQAQTQLLSAQNQEQSILLQRAQLENSIAALIGQPASGFRIESREEWDLPTPQFPAGIPSELLKRRPDIASSERQMAAASANIGATEVSAYFPSLTLTGNYGTTSSTLGKLFDAASITHSFGASLAGTLLDFGSRRAQVDAARDQYVQSMAAYRQTVLTAFQDVENDLAGAQIYAKEFDILTQDSQAADLAEQLTLNQYKAGTADMTTVVTAQAAALTARISLAQMKVERQTNAVTLVTDLGGGWQVPDYSQYD